MLLYLEAIFTVFHLFRMQLSILSLGFSKDLFVSSVFFLMLESLRLILEISS